MSEEPLLRIEDLKVRFVGRKGEGYAVNGVSFAIARGETLGLVGESGCGKSITSLAIVGLLSQGAEVAGHIWFDGQDLVGKTQTQLRDFRGNHITMVLQDPLGALHPLFTVGQQIGESVKLHQRLTGRNLRQKVVELLQQLRIPKPEERLESFPHQFSGGMRQRVVSAIALAGDPQLLIADEPTTALDVTVQAAYLSLLKDIQAERSLSILFISHDLGVIAEVCHRVAVMYSGGIVEMASTREILSEPKHPYTEALLHSVPDVRRDVERLASIEGFPPSIYEPPAGCRFHPRCPRFLALGQPQRCRSEEPQLNTVVGRSVACHFVQ